MWHYWNVTQENDIAYWNSIQEQREGLFQNFVLSFVRAYWSVVTKKVQTKNIEMGHFLPREWTQLHVLLLVTDKIHQEI